MIKVIIKTSNIRGKEVMAEVTDTPAKVFDDLGVGLSGSSINLNGIILAASDLNQSFEALGTSDGATVNLNAVVKSDGANA